MRALDRQRGSTSCHPRRIGEQADRTALRSARHGPGSSSRGQREYGLLHPLQWVPDERIGLMSHLFTVANGVAVPMVRTTLGQQGFLETTHLEQWVVEHPEILGDGVMVVATQFDQWRSDAGDSARERLDILGLDTNGQLLVVELKREGDRRVHLQAITYAALVANFTAEELGRVHARHLSKITGISTTPEEALLALTEHVDGDWDLGILGQPRVVLIAERFPPQVLTTAQYLTNVSGGTITIECIEVHLFQGHDDSAGTCANFHRLWPVDDIQDRMLSPRLEEAQETQRKLVERKRRARSAKIIVDNDLIEPGEGLRLDLARWISQDVVAEVNSWLAAAPERRDVTWVADAGQPLAWGYESGRAFSPTRLAKEIIKKATASEPQSVPGGDVWYLREQSLSQIANAFLDAGDTDGV